MSDAPYFFTWSAQKNPMRMRVVGGSGPHFFTESGEKWLDLASLSYQASLGHGHGRMIQAVAKQASEMCLAPPWADYPAKEELAAELLRLAPPGFSKVFFTLGGAEAVENAMKIARLYTGRHKFISRYRSYHGASLGALSLTGDFRRPPLEPAIPGVVHLLRDDERDVQDILRFEGPKQTAAVVLEPVQGANGVYLPVPGFWPAVREACNADGALLIADEVLTGFGRTGTCFAVEQLGVVPDIITCAKALTAGYVPLGAVLVSEKVAQKFEDDTLWCGLTNYAHPLGCAAGREALAIYREEGLYSRGKDLQPLLTNPLNQLAATLGPNKVVDVRAMGALCCLELRLTAEEWSKLVMGLHAKKILVHESPKRGTVIVAPPLNIDVKILQQGMTDLCDVVTKAVA